MTETITEQFTGPLSKQSKPFIEPFAVMSWHLTKWPNLIAFHLSITPIGLRYYEISILVSVNFMMLF